MRASSSTRNPAKGPGIDHASLGRVAGACRLRKQPVVWPAHPYLVHSRRTRRFGMICEFAMATLSIDPTRREIRAPREHLILQRYATVHRGTRPRAHRPHARPARRRRAALGQPRSALRGSPVLARRSLRGGARARKPLPRRRAENTAPHCLLLVAVTAVRRRTD